MGEKRGEGIECQDGRRDPAGGGARGQTTVGESKHLHRPRARDTLRTGEPHRVPSFNPNLISGIFRFPTMASVQLLSSSCPRASPRFQALPPYLPKPEILYCDSSAATSIDKQSIKIPSRWPSFRFPQSSACLEAFYRLPQLHPSISTGKMMPCRPLAKDVSLYLHLLLLQQAAMHVPQSLSRSVQRLRSQTFPSHRRLLDPGKSYR